MFQDRISRASFLAVLAMATPAFADDTATLNALNQQVQDQQKEIQQLMADAKANKAKAHKAAAAPVADHYTDAADVVEAGSSKPGVVAPLQPSSLGTLSTRDLVNQPSLGTVSQAAAPMQQPSKQQPIVGTGSYAPRLPPVQPLPQSVAVLPAPVPQQVQPVSPVASAAPAQVAAATIAPTAQVAPGHVGEAPAMATKPPEVQALANVGGVLTPYGKVVIEPFLQYSRSSVNSFVFEGVQFVDSVLVGAVDANRTARDLVSTGATVRVGVNDRMEVEARIPYVWRQDSITNTIPNSSNQTITNNAQGYGLGDLEIAGHYQINEGREDWPFFIANLRYKSDTGSSPYKSEFNADGTAHTLATGSGFMAIEPSVTVIYPSDPATLFANLGYIHSFDEDVNGPVGNVFIGNVAPGDTYSASVGMGIALNDRLSFTLGYEHDYVRPTATVIGGSGSVLSQSLQVGSALSGIAFRVNPRTSVVLNLAAGVTKDAPDSVVSLRVPITLNVF